MNKKVVVLGGGTGLSTLLRGLKEYPVDISAIVSVCDDGSSTGILREEFNIPAVGDIRKVIAALAETEPLVQELLNYRFKTTSDLNGHTVGNLLLTATTNITGNMSDGIEALSHVLNLKGKVIPLTEENVVLNAEMEDGSIVKGEHHITEDKRKIKKVFYDTDPIPSKGALRAISHADLIVLSMGSLFTSIIPNLLCSKLIEALDNSKAKILYVCNMVTQPGETDGFSVMDHVNMINSYLGKHKIDVVVANNGVISKEIAKKYETKEQKNPVNIDYDNVKDIKLIEDDLVCIEDEIIRHDYMLLGFHIFEYLIKCR